MPGRDLNTPSYPMYVVSVVNLLKLTRLPSHEELLAQGLLVEVNADQPQCCVHFVSQRWLGPMHPDPDGVKLRRFQNVCLHIIHEDPTSLFDPTDWEAFSTGSSASQTWQAMHKEQSADSRRLSDEMFKENVKHGYVWWDYVSVPQGTSEAAQRKQCSAIDSIHSYIERSSYFWVVVPETKTESGDVEDYEAWQTRGWCRLEEWGNFLSVRVAPPLILTNAQRLGVVNCTDFLWLRSGFGGLASHAACEGKFTCCKLGHKRRLPDGREIAIRCDKKYVGIVLERMFRRKLSHYKQSGAQLMHQCLKASAYSVLAGSGLESRPGTVEELLELCGFEKADTDNNSLTPMTWACSFSSAQDLVKALMDQGARPDQTPSILQTAAHRGDSDVLQLLLGQVDQEAVCRGTQQLNITSLDRAAKVGHASACSLLLAANASPHAVRKDNGQTPLHAAAEGGFHEVCTLLLGARASVDSQDQKGSTPLRLAAQRLSLFGKSSGKAQCASVLLEARADPSIRDASGKSPYDVAAEEEHMEVLRVLGDHAAAL